MIPPPWKPPFLPTPPLARRGLPPPRLPVNPVAAVMQRTPQLGPLRRRSSPNLRLQNISARIRAQINAANSLNFPNTSLTLLAQVLPGLIRVMNTYNVDLSAAINVLLNSHAGTEESSGVPYLTDANVFLAYETCLRAIKAAGTSEHLLKSGPRGLITHLENAITIDQSHLRLRRVHLSGTLRTFRALAEVSRQTSSQSLGSLLYDFFRYYQRYFWTIHEPENLAWWVYALCRLYISEHEMERVMETAVRECPDIVDVLEYHADTPEIEEVYHLAVEVEEALQRRVGMRKPQGRFGGRRPRLRRRSSTNDAWGKRGWQSRGWGRSLTPPPRSITAPPPTDARLALQARKVVEGARKLGRMVGDGSDTE
ncbi:hypothetical protein EJ03DRAFT_372432 [Teratosphaeria nubilosa]|uniref:Uncharacterized protein n=1 Tax=Teratosphaeria nubilosa TaxID=161662 RepID=A0A6G1LG73_9PEZI|nr:hypothetical protein EJ03DRAFT_372432 [Teratosphaeria nubilosa]